MAKITGIRNNTQVVLNGKVTFSQFTKPIQGEALEKSIARDKSQYPTRDVHVNLSLKDVTFDTPIGNPADPELIVHQRNFINGLEANLFSSKDKSVTRQLTLKKKATGKMNLAQDFTGLVPNVFQRVFDEQGNPTNSIKQVILENELAKDVNVSVVVKCFETSHGNNSYTIETVIINEAGPIRCYNGNTGLAGLGLIVEDAPAVQAQESIVQEAVAPDYAVAPAQPVVPVVPQMAPVAPVQPVVPQVAPVVAPVAPTPAVMPQMAPVAPVAPTPAVMPQMAPVAPVAPVAPAPAAVPNQAFTQQAYVPGSVQATPVATEEAPAQFKYVANTTV